MFVSCFFVFCFVLFFFYCYGDHRDLHSFPTRRSSDLVPLLNLAVPADNPFHISSYTVTILGKYLTYALLAVAVDLVWGYLGILSLGHGAFFALGGYAVGMYLMRQIGERGVYGDPILPDFMVFLDRKSTRLNSSHVVISYAVFCLKKKNIKTIGVFYSIYR